MPLYDYECEYCKKIHEISHRMFDESQQLCPFCNKEIHKIPTSPMGAFRGESRTVGSVADKNANTYSKSQKIELDSTHDRQRKERIPQWYDKYGGKTAKAIQKMSSQEKRKYVETGK